MKVHELFEKKDEAAEKVFTRLIHLLHHIAEEELGGCVVHEVKPVDNNTIHIIADCHDKPRKEGVQADLTAKVNERLKLHKLPHIGKVDCKVYHLNTDQYQLKGDK